MIRQLLFFFSFILVQGLNNIGQTQIVNDMSYLRIIFSDEHQKYMEFDLSTPQSKHSESNVILKVHSYNELNRVHIRASYIDSICLVNKVFFDTLGRCHCLYRKGITDYYYTNDSVLKIFRKMVDYFKDDDVIWKGGSGGFFPKSGVIFCLDTINSRIRTVSFNQCADPNKFIELVNLAKQDKRFQKAFYLQCGGKYHFIKNR